MLRKIVMSTVIAMCIGAGIAAAEISTEANPLAQDVRILSASRQQLHDGLLYLQSRKGLFSPNGKKKLLVRDDKMALWSTWSSILKNVSTLDSLRQEYKDFLGNGEESRKASFIIYRASYVASYRHALELISILESNRSLDTVLNEEVPELGLPKGTYADFKFHFLHAGRASEFAALETLAKGVELDPLRDTIAAAKEDSDFIWKMGKGKGYLLTVENAGRIIRDTGFKAWFPVQKGISTWMGDTRVRRGNSSLISDAQIKGMIGRLQPGDILLERREWYLSNAGLPGFWTHAALYIGTSDERSAFFADKEVYDWVKGEGRSDGNLELFLQERYPEAYRTGLTLQEGGHQPRVLEAISEGVSFTTLEHSAASDSLAVLRPRLSKREKAEAVGRAFHYSGRPYDFNFDFLTDSSLVCSELIYKAYEPGKGMKGMIFSLDEIMGRRIATPNGIARSYQVERRSGMKPQTSLVLFMDGYEKAGKAIEATEADFMGSWKRPNWHVMVQDSPPTEKLNAVQSSTTGHK